jgi:hypothetical protein
MLEILGYVLAVCAASWIIYTIYKTQNGLSDGSIDVDLKNHKTDEGNTCSSVTDDMMHAGYIGVFSEDD